ncbi:UmuC_domain [Hexamita inflata]|uniref:UmuC domain n=1 Tax=Hexamita inflata TaxID=28002 RepID=A0AA86UTJ0_9EUKA|nr:UmuC domain [Hexamita inflata]
MFKVPTKLAQIKAREVISPQNSDASSLPPVCGIRRQMPVVSKQRLCLTHKSENEVLFPSMMQLLRDNTLAARVHMKHHNIQNNTGQNKNVSYFSVDEAFQELNSISE